VPSDCRLCAITQNRARRLALYIQPAGVQTNAPFKGAPAVLNHQDVFYNYKMRHPKTRRNNFDRAASASHCIRRTLRSGGFLVAGSATGESSTTLVSPGCRDAEGSALAVDQNQLKSWQRRFENTIVAQSSSEFAGILRAFHGGNELGNQFETNGWLRGIRILGISLCPFQPSSETAFASGLIAVMTN